MSAHKESSVEAFNIKEFILKAISYKYFYVSSLIICLVGAFLINRFSPTIYEVKSILGPVENKRTSLLGGANNLFSGTGAYSESRNLENDINSLNSFSLVSATLNKLNLEVGYFIEKNKIIKQKQQIYPDTPFKVSIDKSHVQPINARFYVVILNNQSFRIRSSEDEISLYNYVDNVIVSKHNIIKIDTLCRFNETIDNKNFKFSVSYNKEYYTTNLKNRNRFYFEFYHLDLLGQQYLKKLKTEQLNIKSSLINVRFKGENIGLTIDFLNRFLETYLDDNLSKKNKISFNTVKFIDSQISEISDSLAKSESKLRDYRSDNQVTNLSYQGQQALEQMNKIEAERSTLQIQERYYNYILDYFSKNQDMAGLAPPSAANVVDPIMNQLILELLTLNSQKSGILTNNTEKNLYLGQIENKIKLQKQAIIENVKNNLNTLNLNQNELNYRADKLSKEISKLPRTELNMVSMQRKFNLTDAIYTYLLQKRSEAAITMASNYPDYEILDPAREVLKTILSPRTMINYILAVFLAFLIPTIFILLKDFFNEKISTVTEVEYFLKKSVLSIIFTNPYKTEAVVTESPGSSIAESFRNLRSSLFLRFRSEPLKVIMITSSQPQDGKSFISLNLAASIASVGYKSVILDCDTRRPSLHEKFKKDNSKGITTYMTNHTLKEDIILETDIENLSFIPAGPFLPNSSELVESGALDELIEYLKAKYNYIIIDAPPAGLVADFTMIIKYASLILLVCRNNYTRKDTFNDILNFFRTNRIENFDVIFNDLNVKRTKYGRYNTYFQK